MIDRQDDMRERITQRIIVYMFIATLSVIIFTGSGYYVFGFSSIEVVDGGEIIPFSFFCGGLAIFIYCNVFIALEFIKLYKNAKVGV